MLTSITCCFTESRILLKVSDNYIYQKMNKLYSNKKARIYNLSSALSWPDWLTIKINGSPVTKTLLQWYIDDPAAVVLLNKQAKGPFICKAVYMQFVAKHCKFTNRNQKY